MLPKSQSSTFVSREGEQKREQGSRLIANQPCVPVLSVERKPLMPTTPSRARRWIKEGKATPFYSKGIFCVRLNGETGKHVQEIACGIDPGSKKEGFTVKSEAHTFLNIQADAVTWVKDAVEVRRNMRRARRFRKTPCRKNRENRARGCLPPSTKARWQWKLRLATWLSKVYPISCFVVEDINAKTKGQRKWDRSFSPLEVGKKWFYGELSNLGKVELKQGWETAELRTQAGLKKTKKKVTTLLAKASSFLGNGAIPVSAHWPRPGQESARQDIPGGVLVSVQGQATVRTDVLAHREVLADLGITPTAPLARPSRIHSHHRRTGTCSLVRQDLDKAGPASVRDCSAHPVAPQHPLDVQAFHRDQPVATDQIQGGFEVMLAPQIGDAGMYHTDRLAGLAAIRAALLLATHRTLCAAQGEEFLFQESTAH